MDGFASMKRAEEGCRWNFCLRGFQKARVTQFGEAEKSSTVAIGNGEWAWQSIHIFFSLRQTTINQADKRRFAFFYPSLQPTHASLLCVIFHSAMEKSLICGETFLHRAQKHTLAWNATRSVQWRSKAAATPPRAEVCEQRESIHSLVGCWWQAAKTVLNQENIIDTMKNGKRRRRTARRAFWGVWRSNPESVPPISFNNMLIVMIYWWLTRMNYD